MLRGSKNTSRGKRWACVGLVSSILQGVSAIAAKAKRQPGLLRRWLKRSAGVASSRCDVGPFQWSRGARQEGRQISFVGPAKAVRTTYSCTKYFGVVHAAVTAAAVGVDRPVERGARPHLVRGSAPTLPRPRGKLCPRTPACVLNVRDSAADPALAGRPNLGEPPWRSVDQPTSLAYWNIDSIKCRTSAR